MTNRSTGEGESKSEYTNNQCKREQKPVRLNHAMKVSLHNPAKLEIQQERKRFLPSQRAACRSERWRSERPMDQWGKKKTRVSTRTINARESENQCVRTMR